MPIFHCCPKLCPVNVMRLKIKPILEIGVIYINDNHHEIVVLAIDSMAIVDPVVT